MWADILTKPLQGPKFCTMCAFLMNCPVEYSDDTPFIPSPLPTLALTPLPKKPSVSSSNSTSVPTKPQIPSILPSSRGGVGMQSQGMVRCVMKHTIPASSCRHVPKYPTSLEKKVTWRDALFPQQTLEDLASSKPDLHHVWPAAE
jgi:hypothetical protein